MCARLKAAWKALRASFVYIVQSRDKFAPHTAETNPNLPAADKCNADGGLYTECKVELCIVYVSHMYIFSI